MSRFRPAEAPPEARTLSGADYSSEAVFQRERGRLFSEGWVCVGHRSLLPGPGEYCTLDLPPESVLLVRGADHPARAFHNHCRHRGARLCSEETGSIGRTVTCPYHGWCYGPDGSLVAARHMDRTPGFRREEWPLHPVGMEEWNGLLFLRLAGPGASWDEEFGFLRGGLEGWSLPNLLPARRIEYRVRANWKLVIENYSECYHCPRIHPELCRLSPADSGRNDFWEGPFLGGYMDLLPHAGTMADDGAPAYPPLPGLLEQDRRRVYYYALFPNLLLSLHPDYVMCHYLWPLAAGETRITCEWYFPREATEATGFDPGPAVRFWDRVNRQDWHACELCQLGTASAAYRPGPYARSEGLCHAFDREYLRRMGEGGPPTPP